MVQLRSVTRGRLRQIARADDGHPVDVGLYAARVLLKPYEKNGKTYAMLDLTAAAGDLATLRQVDAFVARAANPAFTPLLDGGTRVIVKLQSVKYENAQGDAALPWTIEDDMLVDVVLRPGAFGDFGYCWLLHRVKPHALRTQ